MAAIVMQKLDMKILEAEVIDVDAEEEYLESVLQREKVSYTNFNNIAIPHGNSKYVK